MTKENDRDSGAAVKLIAGMLDDKKAGDIKILDVRKMSELWDYFVVCSGLSTVHVKTLYDAVYDGMNRLGRAAAHRDTGHDNKWIILDYGDIMVHIFDAESRQYYSIEKIWGEKEELAAKFIKRVSKEVKAKKEKAKIRKKAKVKNAKKRKK